jgi:hypothetical protein
MIGLGWSLWREQRSPAPTDATGAVTRAASTLDPAGAR